MASGFTDNADSKPTDNCCKQLATLTCGDRL